MLATWKWISQWWRGGYMKRIYVIHSGEINWKFYLFENQNLIAKSGIGRVKVKKLILHGCWSLPMPSLDYDVLHINTYGEYIIWSIRHTNWVKVVYHGHSTYEDFEILLLVLIPLPCYLKRYLVSLYSKSDAIITPTPYSKQLLRGYRLNQPIIPISTLFH